MSHVTMEQIAIYFNNILLNKVNLDKIPNFISINLNNNQYRSSRSAKLSKMTVDCMIFVFYKVSHIECNKWDTLFSIIF